MIGVIPLVSKALIGYFRPKRNLRRYKRPKHFDYNLVAIGGSSAGLVSAYIAATMKAKFALIEKHKMGGIFNAKRVAEMMTNGVTKMNAGQGFTASLVTGVIT